MFVVYTRVRARGPTTIGACNKSSGRALRVWKHMKCVHPSIELFCGASHDDDGTEYATYCHADRSNM